MCVFKPRVTRVLLLLHATAAPPVTCPGSFSCRSSGKAHICTPDLCNEPRDTIDGFMHCRLTGKVLGSAKLSYGWIEDSWRPVIAKKQKQKPSLVPQESTNSASCVAQITIKINVMQQLMKTPPNGDHKGIAAVRDLSLSAIKSPLRCQITDEWISWRTVLDQKGALAESRPKL